MPWQVSLLSLFARMEYTLPNICAALLTRRSIFTALTHGVGVEVCHLSEPEPCNTAWRRPSWGGVAGLVMIPWVGLQGSGRPVLAQKRDVSHTR